MTKTLLCALFLLVAGVFALPARGQTQAQMNIDSKAQLDDADAALNKVYKELMAASAEDEGFCSDLKEAQRAWLKFVEYHMKTLFPLKEGESPRVVYGSIYPTSFAEAKTELIEARTAQLQAMLEHEN